jgi:hypothetical protein
MSPPKPQRDGLVGLLGKLFSKPTNRDAERVRQIFEQALKESKKPQGPHKMALLGAETRQQLLGRGGC